MKLGNTLAALNVQERCRVYRVGLWQCPHFLFILMGLIIAISIIGTHFVAQRYAEPETVVSIVFIATTILFVIGNAIVKAFEQVAEASRLKSEFVSIISHELRNPLTSIKWQLNLLMERKKLKSQAEVENASNIIAHSNESMIGLINQLLDVNNIEDGTFILSPSTFSLGELTRKMVEESEGYARSRNLKLILLLPKTQFWVKADESRIKSVISRFIDNAIRYSTSRGDVAITLEDLGHSVRWAITDQGVGIPAEEVKRIFSKFFRAQNILRYQTEGLGVGLYIAKYIIEASGGIIGFRTLEGHGSTFFFTLPQVK